MSDIQTKIISMPRNEKTQTPNEKNNQPIKTDPELTKLLEFADKDIRAVIGTVFHMFGKLSRDMKDIKRSNPNF